MAHLNIEIKARCDDPARVRKALLAAGAEFRGRDRQIDTYFRCRRGRLKLREGNIEKSLIHYDRPDQAAPKGSQVSLAPTGDDAGPLKATLTAAMGVWAVVDKQREIYFIDNVKFHIDAVENLGSFVEIEAIDADGSLGAARLHAQCERYMALLGVEAADLAERSYSDMLGEKDERD